VDTAHRLSNHEAAGNARPTKLLFAITENLRNVGRDKVLSFPAISGSMVMPATTLMQAYFY